MSTQRHPCSKRRGLDAGAASVQRFPQLCSCQSGRGKLGATHKFLLDARARHCLFRLSRPKLRNRLAHVSQTLTLTFIFFNGHPRSASSVGRRHPHINPWPGVRNPDSVPHLQGKGSQGDSCKCCTICSKVGAVLRGRNCKPSSHHRSGSARRPKFRAARRKQ